jgi:RND family efflux transporter MFP subunit
MTTMIKESTKIPPATPVKTQASPTGKRGPGIVTLILVLLFCVALGFGIFAGIQSRVKAETALTRETRASAIPFVSVIHPTPGSNASEVLLPGNTQAFTDAPLYARTSGYLKAWYADIGAEVKQGQLLAEIETPEVDQQLQQAQANLQDTQANLAISKTTAGRYEDLLKSNSVSHQETDQAMSDLQSKKALVDASLANVRRLQQLKDFQKIYAPFDGVITVRSTDIGHLVQAGDSTTTRELFHMAAIGKLRVYASVPEVYSSTVKSGAKVTLTLDSFPGETFTGTIVRNSDSIDPATRTLNVEIDVDNPTGRLLPGAYAFVHLKIPANSGSVTVPSNTLLFRAEGLRVGVVRDGHVVLTPITIGHDYGSTVEVVSGLSPDDAVIVDPSDSLADGAAVQSQGPLQKGATP